MAVVRGASCFVCEMARYGPQGVIVLRRFQECIRSQEGFKGGSHRNILEDDSYGWYIVMNDVV